MARTLAGFAPGSSGGQDLRLDGRGNLAVVDGLEDVRQRVVMRLKFLFGEWYQNIGLGMPYRSEIFTRPITIGLAESIISNAIRRVPGVTGVAQVRVSIEPVTRRLSYMVRVQTPYGMATVEL